MGALLRLAARTLLVSCLLPVPIASAQGASIPAGHGAPEPMHQAGSSASTSLSTDSFAERQHAARDLAFRYLDLWSSSNRVALASAASFYEPSFRFHGRNRTLESVLDEKRGFAERWPDRVYRYRPGTTYVGCDVDGPNCTVWSIFDFVATGPKRLRRSTGIGEHELVISFAGVRPAIVSENSRVLLRGVVYTESDLDGLAPGASLLSGGPSASLAACEKAIAKASLPYGSTHVSVANVEPETTGSNPTTLRLRARIEYRDGARREVRSARVTCRLGEDGEVVTIR